MDQVSAPGPGRPGVRGCVNTGERTMERRKFVIGLGALAAGSSAAVGTGAFTAAELSGRDVGVTVSDDSDGLVALRAGSTEFVEQEGGELGIDVSNEDAGVNPNSKYQIGQIPSNLADQPALGGTTPLSEGSNMHEDDHAFKIVNQSPSTQDIEVDVDMDDCPDDATIYLIGYSPDTVEAGVPSGEEGKEALAAGKLYGENDWEGLLSFTSNTSGNIEGDSGIVNEVDEVGPIGPGGTIYISILIVRGDKTTNTSSEEWSGTMTVRAGENDDIFVPQ